MLKGLRRRLALWICPELAEELAVYDDLYQLAHKRALRLQSELNERK
jgi:hypothetical protein